MPQLSQTQYIWDPSHEAEQITAGDWVQDFNTGWSACDLTPLMWSIISSNGLDTELNVLRSVGLPVHAGGLARHMCFGRPVRGFTQSTRESEMRPQDQLIEEFLFGQNGHENISGTLKDLGYLETITKSAVKAFASSQGIRHQISSMTQWHQDALNTMKSIDLERVQLFLQKGALNLQTILYEEGACRFVTSLYIEQLKGLLPDSCQHLLVQLLCLKKVSPETTAELSRYASRRDKQKIERVLAVLGHWMADLSAVRGAKKQTVKIIQVSAMRIGHQRAGSDDLQKPEEINFLTLEELSAAPGSHLQETICYRQARDQFCRGLKMPLRFSGLPAIEFVKEDEFSMPPSVSNETISLVGTGVSTGRATGTARVIRNARDIAKAAQGNILICENTGPLELNDLPSVSGVVTKTGNLVSEVSIWAREKGVACIVCPEIENLPRKENRFVHMDGTSGAISFISRNAINPELLK